MFKKKFKRNGLLSIFMFLLLFSLGSCYEDVYLISGKVILNDSSGLEGVTLTLSEVDLLNSTVNSYNEMIKNAQCIDGDCFNGRGVAVYSGFEYKGKWKNGLMHGYGVGVTPKGDTYNGFWIKGLMHGMGTAFFVNGDKYIGDWRKAEMHGQGIFFTTKGYNYNGYFRKGKRHGKGKETWSNGDRFQGSFKMGKKHGRGTYFYADGREYTCVWENGKPDRNVLNQIDNSVSIPGQFMETTIYGDAAAEGGVVVTNSEGEYTFNEVEDGSYTITPFMEGYTFTPASIGVTVEGSDVTVEDFIAEGIPNYTVNGFVMLDGSGLDNVQIDLIGEDLARRETSNSEGAYAFNDVENGSYTVTPFRVGYTFMPASIGVTVEGADVTVEAFVATAVFNEDMIIDHKHTDLTLIPQSAIEQAKTNLHIAYGHTSHGSQLTTGMSGLVSFINEGGLGLSLPDNIFQWNNGGSDGALDFHDGFASGDLGNPDRTTWADRTRAYLENSANEDVNVIIWSWCGQADTTEANIQLYLDLMTTLESEYSGVKFVYMTGHATGSGETGNLHIRNQQIRNYCIDNNKILYDFYDIECYDPDGNYFGDKLVNDNCDYDSDNNGSRDRNWALDWQGSHEEGEDWYSCSSAHSQALNANRKAYAAWWLWCRLGGWDGI